VCTMRGARCSVRASVVRCLTQRSVSSVPCQDGSLGPREHGWGMRDAHALLLQIGRQPLPLQAGTALFHVSVASLLAGSYIGSDSPAQNKRAARVPPHGRCKKNGPFHAVSK